MAYIMPIVLGQVQETIFQAATATFYNRWDEVPAAVVSIRKSVALIDGLTFRKKRHPLSTLLRF